MTRPRHPGTGHWWHHAACKGMDTALFFPEDRSSPAGRARIRTALAVCSRCPVRVQCGIEAARTHATGIWGGTDRTIRTRSAADRRSLTL